jgi:DNA-binding Xre family transcriptional regulator
VIQVFFTDKLDLLMKEKDITRGELAKQAKVPYTTIVSFYDKGSDNVKLSTLKKLCLYFNCSLDYLTCDDSEDRYYGIKQPAVQLSPSELSHIQKYRLLSPAGQKAADGVMDVIYEYEQSFKQATIANVIDVDFRLYAHYDIPASAGTGLTLDSDSYELMEAPEAPPQTTFLLTASGDSMEPRIFEGDFVLIDKTSAIDNGNIVAVIVDDEDGTIKKIAVKLRYESATKKIARPQLRERGFKYGVFFRDS